VLIVLDELGHVSRRLIAELHVNSRNEILPTYHVGAPVVRAPNSSVERIVRCANPPLFGASALDIS
jgi:hypothetical protein